ncbi:hypothetical protein [Mycobacterium neglectum]|uniref:hypothetical protein n=1 Tax=Mycobacterium neglectum TaxID=242737 RepID=UPI001FE99CDF|nr:hypothetical protein [Mycobacterium neglectum]
MAFSRRLGSALAIVLCSYLVLTVCGLREPPNARHRIQPFATDSPFRTPVAHDAPVDVNSPQIVARLSRDDGLYANLVEFAIPIYEADDDAPRTSVSCRITDWGPCPFAGYSVPIPEDAEPSPGSDGAMVVVDNDRRLIFEFWQARREGTRWTTSFGAVNDLDGSGWGTHDNGFSTGSGASRLGGVIRIDEMRRGVIPHALALQSDSVCAGVFRPPAVKTDGTYRGSDCIPEGARIRLDPDVDISALDLTLAGLAVAQALQTYGAYIVDYGGAPLSVAFERDTAASDHSPGAIYQHRELLWDYSRIDGIPWERIEVLA